MKEKYFKPQIKIDEFCSVDIVTTSGDTQPDDNIVDGSTGWD